MSTLRHIGFAIKKNELWYAIIDGTNKNNCQIVYCGKHNFQADQDFADLMQCFYGLFNEILTDHKPDTVAYKVHLESTLSQVPYMHCSLGILGYLCKNLNISASPRSSSWITAGKKKKQQECIDRFPDEKLKTEKLAAVLLAWFQFCE